MNVGDSGFMLFRDEEMVYKSPVQQRGFNCPYQLGRSKGSDRPSSAEVHKFEIHSNFRGRLINYFFHN